jgi:hypothetical protein
MAHQPQVSGPNNLRTFFFVGHALAMTFAPGQPVAQRSIETDRSLGIHGSASCVDVLRHRRPTVPRLSATSRAENHLVQGWSRLSSESCSA